MVKGPCRGRKCDFWARVKIRKSTIDRLVEDLVTSIVVCYAEGRYDIEDAFHQYWTLVGVRDREVLCVEEPELCGKMRAAEDRAAAMILASKH